MNFDSVTFFLDDIPRWKRWFVDVLGFCSRGQARSSEGEKSGRPPILSHLRPELQTTLQSRDVYIHLVAPSPSSQDTPTVQQYLHHHPPGVGNLAFRVDDVDAAFGRAVDAGAIAIQVPQHCQTLGGWVKQATVSGWGDLRHTLVEYLTPAAEFASVKLPVPNLTDAGLTDADVKAPPLKTREPKTPTSITFAPNASGSNASDSKTPGSNPSDANPSELKTPDRMSPEFTTIDHAVLNVPIGEMEKAATWYADAFGFECKQTFSIQTPRSALRSMVMSHPHGTATVPINEPASANSQIQEFLDVNRGAGIQHIALATDDIMRTMARLRRNGLDFLKVPPSYYEQLPSRPGFGDGDSDSGSHRNMDWGAIARQEVLVDWQADRPEARLLQAFTQPIFGEPTFFFEVIQRQRYRAGTLYRQAEGFGEGNFQALFEAMEREQVKRGRLPSPR